MLRSVFNLVRIVFDQYNSTKSCTCVREEINSKHSSVTQPAYASSMLCATAWQICSGSSLMLAAKFQIFGSGDGYGPGEIAGHAYGVEGPSRDSGARCIN